MTRDFPALGPLPATDPSYGPVEAILGQHAARAPPRADGRVDTEEVKRLTRSWAIGIGAIAVGLSSGCSSGDKTNVTTSTSAPGSTSTTGTTTTGTPSTTTEATSSTAAGTMVVQVFFLDQDAFNIGRPPYVVPVERTVSSTAPARAALDELFAGLTADESASGLRLVTSQATGVSELRIEDGTAHVRLAGGCNSGGSTFNVGDEIAATLRQFPTVDTVKIYDPDGKTERPDSPGDSIPECLEP